MPEDVQSRGWALLLALLLRLRAGTVHLCRMTECSDCHSRQAQLVQGGLVHGTPSGASGRLSGEEAPGKALGGKVRKLSIT